MQIGEITTIRFWLVPIFLVLTAGVSILFQDNYQYLILTVVLAFFFYRSQNEIDIALIYVVCFWLFINIISVKLINREQEHSVVTIFSRIMTLFIVYFIIKLSGKDFFDRLNAHVYVLTIIGLIAYTVQMIAPSVIQSLGKYFMPLSRPGFSMHGNWYAYFYTYSAWHPFRNCGFMWEPGAFAGFLIFMITYRFSVNKFKFDKYIIVYLIGLVTSLSTAGYLALFILMIAFFIRAQKRYFVLIILIPVMVFYLIKFYKQNEFLSTKIEAYISQGTGTWGGMHEDGAYRTTRLGYAMIVLDESRDWPFGHGVIIHSSYKLDKYGVVIGPGALSEILHQWGWIGCILVTAFIYRFYRRKLDTLTSIIFTLALLVVLFSNPEEFLMIIYSIMFFMISNNTKSVMDTKEYVAI